MDENYTQPKTVDYHRPPTKAEISFGYGCTHYISIPIAEAMRKDGRLKPKLRKDGMWYYR